MQPLRLRDYTCTEAVNLSLNAGTKTQALRLMAETLGRAWPELDTDHVATSLLERERLGSTGIGKGDALPHGRVSGAHKPRLAFGVNTESLDFDAIDDEPVRLIATLLAPKDCVGVHLKILGRLAELLRDKALRRELTTSTSSDHFLNTLLRHDEA